MFLNRGNLRGILWVVGAMSAWTLVASLTKMVVGTRVDAQTAVFVRTILLLLIFSPIIILKRGRFIKTHFIHYHVLRGIFFGVSAICSAYAVSAMTISEANAFLLTTPIIMLPLCAIFLGERINSHKVIAVFIGFVGVLVLLQPTAERAVKLATLAALAGASAEAVNGVLLKKSVSMESSNTTIFWSFTFTMFISGALCGFQIVGINWYDIVILGIAAFANLMVIYCYIKGYQSGEAGVVEMGSYSILLFSGFFDLLIFNLLPGRLFLIGAALILISGLIASLGSSET